jgi:hypothetical protein
METCLCVVDGEVAAKFGPLQSRKRSMQLWFRRPDAFGLGIAGHGHTIRRRFGLLLC